MVVGGSFVWEVVRGQAMIDDTNVTFELGRSFDSYGFYLQMHDTVSLHYLKIRSNLIHVDLGDTVIIGYHNIHKYYYDIYLLGVHQ